MSLKPDETDLIGHWVEEGSRVVGDAVESRIGQLIANDLEKVAVSPEHGGWEILYRDPQDGRYWELAYSQSGLHGGGPKRLTNLSTMTAVAKYRLKSS